MAQLPRLLPFALDHQETVTGPVGPGYSSPGRLALCGEEFVSNEANYPLPIQRALEVDRQARPEPLPLSIDAGESTLSVFNTPLEPRAVLVYVTPLARSVDARALSRLYYNGVLKLCTADLNWDFRFLVGHEHVQLLASCDAVSDQEVIALVRSLDRQLAPAWLVASACDRGQFVFDSLLKEADIKISYSQHRLP